MISEILKTFCLTVFISCLASANDAHVGKIIGENDFIPVNAEASNIPEAFRPLVDAFGWTNYGCTVTHIGKGYALSAGHCFEAQEHLETNKSCSYVRVDWGYRTGKKVSLTSHCQNIVAMQKLGDLDFAILKMDSHPEAAVKLNLDSAVVPGDIITIFSHPDGMPLNWSQYCKIESEIHPPIPAELLEYLCDTSGGSSGAVLINTTTLEIIGIHKGGEVNMNYGTPLLRSPLVEILKGLEL